MKSILWILLASLFLNGSLHANTEVAKGRELNLLCVLIEDKESELPVSLSLHANENFETTVSSLKTPNLNYKVRGKYEEVILGDVSKLSFDFQIEKNINGSRTKLWIFERELFSRQNGFEAKVSSIPFSAATSAAKSDSEKSKPETIKSISISSLISFSCKSSL